MRGLFLVSSFGDWASSIADVETDDDLVDDFWVLFVPATTTFEDNDDFEGAWLFFIFGINEY